VEDSTLLFLPKKEFLDLCRHNSEVALAVIRTLAWRFRYLADLVEELSLKEVSHRLARFLRERALRLGIRTRRGIEFPLEETNQQIGAEIGTVRDLVSRNLRRFVDRGIIRLERRKVIVLDMTELEAQAAGAKRASG
jgi:CRP/FNR family transcriptional regulator